MATVNGVCVAVRRLVPIVHSIVHPIKMQPFSVSNLEEEYGDVSEATYRSDFFYLPRRVLVRLPKLACDPVGRKSERACDAELGLWV